MKTVILPITVPSGSYCWEFSGKFECCEHFSNEGGHPSCALGFYNTTDKRGGGALKDPKCNALKTLIHGRVVDDE